MIYNNIMVNRLEYVSNNMEWYYIVLIVLAVLSLLFALFTKNKKIKKIVLDLVIKAEQEIKGTKKGQERFAFVIEQIQLIIPKQLHWFFTDERLKSIIEWAVTQMKKQLEK